MIDYLLKFPNQQAAIDFGVANGFVVVDDAGNTEILLTKLNYALHVIGEYNEKDWWVLFRDCANTPVPEEAANYIVWSSEMKDEEGNPLPRPTEDPDIPNAFWA